MSQAHEPNEAAASAAQLLNEVESLTSDLVDGVLDDAGKRRLEQLLGGSEAARRRYAAFMQLHAELADHFHASANESQQPAGPTAVLGQLGFNSAPGPGAHPPVSD